MVRTPLSSSRVVLIPAGIWKGMPAGVAIPAARRTFSERSGRSSIAGMLRATSIQREWTSCASRPAAGLIGDGGAPARIVEIAALPSPGIRGGTHAIAGTRDVVSAHLPAGDLDGRIGFVARAFPGRAGVGDALGVGVALQQESRSAA